MCSLPIVLFIKPLYPCFTVSVFAAHKSKSLKSLDLAMIYAIALLVLYTVEKGYSLLARKIIYLLELITDYAVCSLDELIK